MSVTLSSAAPVTAAQAERLRGQIIESDRRYFEMGGEIVHLPGADVAFVPGLARCPSALVVQRISAATVAREGAGWARRLEDKLRELGATVARIYADDPEPALVAVLGAAGYEMRREIALVAGIDDLGVGDVELREVGSDADWARKLRFHDDVPERPDGHGASSHDWVHLERAKCAEGMRAFLAWRDNRVVGAISVIPGPGPEPWRLKNIVVHSDHRRRAVGRGMIAGVGELARAASVSRLCLFGVQGTIGEALYRACGFVSTGDQIEWSKDL